MEAIRRVGFLFFVLVIGIFLGTLGLRLADRDAVIYSLVYVMG